MYSSSTDKTKEADRLNILELSSQILEEQEESNLSKLSLQGLSRENLYDDWFYNQNYATKDWLKIELEDKRLINVVMSLGLT